MLWGATTVEECVATVHDAVTAGISLLNLAPRYGDGKAGPLPADLVARIDQAVVRPGPA